MNSILKTEQHPGFTESVYNIIVEMTDNGRTIVTFLVKAMKGELQDFTPCHRMSACKELLHQGSQYEETSVHPEPRPELALARTEDGGEACINSPASIAMLNLTAAPIGNTVFSMRRLHKCSSIARFVFPAKAGFHKSWNYRRPDAFHRHPNPNLSRGFVKHVPDYDRVSSFGIAMWQAHRIYATLSLTSR